MILTVTPNAALDVTYEVDSLTPGQSHRVREVHSRTGGKGVNVAKVLTQLGETVISTGFAGGALRAELPWFVPIAGESRRTVTVVSTQDGSATLFNEPGPQVGLAEWTALCREFDRLAASATVVVLSGSLPPGVPLDGYADLIQRSPAPVILDTDGEPLRHGITAGPALIKPNAAELATLLGRAVGSLVEDCAALGIPVAATLGDRGALLSTPDGVWHAAPPEVVAGNPTGAGDAFTAAMARGLAAGEQWPVILQDAVALSAAAVRAPVAGMIDEQAYQEFRKLVTVQEG
jgi:tagatose 6-phosphate kinase